MSTGTNPHTDAPQVTISRDLFESMMVTSFTNALARDSPVALCVSKNLVEHAALVGPSCLAALISLVEGALDWATDPELAPRESFPCDRWLGVLERLSEIQQARE